jgi:predicted nucleic-acid-binding Zn-ribbon protein
MDDDNEFEGMDKCVCPSCGHNEFERQMIELSYCRVWSDKNGYHDEVLKTDDDHDYLFKCCKCGNDCSGIGPIHNFKVVKA